jgi:hypothetical protein
MQLSRRESCPMNKTLNALAFLTVVSVLSGCAVTYTYEGKKYGSKEDFHRAVESELNSGVASVTPLGAFLTDKKLIFAIPSESTLYAENVRRFVTLQGTQPIGNSKEIIENLTKSNYRGIRAFYEAARRRNIYSFVQFVDMDSMNGSIEPSENSDVVYYIEPSQGSGQWYYASYKQGRQIFSYDRGNPGAAGKAKGFIDALQAQAIRE